MAGREMLGRPAALVAALLAGISPWMVRMSSEALVEMTLVTLFAGSVLCTARGRLEWAYVLAVLASPARWDMAGLIPAVALTDLMRNRRLLRTLAKAGLALTPLALCLAVTGMQLTGQDRGTHYLQVLAEERNVALWQDLHSHWEVILASVSTPPSRKAAGGFLILYQATPVVLWLTALPLGLMFLWGSWLGVDRGRATATHEDAGARRRRSQPAPSCGRRAPLHEKNLGGCAGVACGVHASGPAGCAGVSAFGYPQQRDADGRPDGGREGAPELQRPEPAIP
jgi:hypothetical protein